MDKTVEEAFFDSGALMRGHFLLSSGLHSHTYIEKFRVLERPDLLGPMCQAMAGYYYNQNIRFVAGPTVGGMLIAYEVAKNLCCSAIYLEREEGKRTLRRAAAIPKGANVLVVDDVLTTGKSIVEVIDCLKQEQANIVGVGVLVDRSSGEIDFGVPYKSLWKVAVDTYIPEECPQCKQGLALASPGSRHKK